MTRSSVFICLVCIIFHLTVTGILKAKSTCEARTFPGAFGGQLSLCQQWDAEQQAKFWFLSQGSQIMPYRWFLALNQPGNNIKFIDPEFIDRFRYLPQLASKDNPDGLPIGFTKGEARGSDWYRTKSDNWLGINCAACHTNQIEYSIKGRTHKFLIDGGPAMADFEGFFNTLALALEETLKNPRRFKAFANIVLSQNDGGATNKRKLKKHLTEVVQKRKKWNAHNKGEHLYGFGRLDAIGAILNEVVGTAIGDPKNFKSANAPVNPPFIWNTPQYDFVQWDGFVNNRDNNGTGALVRNVGEVLGVFGDLTLNDTNILNIRKNSKPVSEGHTTSVNFENLGVLEELLWDLRSPKMPEIMRDSSEDTTIGEVVFMTKCAACHAQIDENSKLEFKAKLVPVASLNLTPSGIVVTQNFERHPLGTDILRAENLVTRIALTGRFAGLPISYRPDLNSLVLKKTRINLRRKNFFKINQLTGKPPLIERKILVKKSIIGPVDLAANMLKFATAGSLANALDKNPNRFFPIVNAGRPIPREYMNQENPAPCNDRGLPALCYKARSLNGIWATGPYLHNGSVRTLKQVITGKRDNTFKIGSREYDTEELGFKNAGDFVFDTKLKGNSNKGHLYGAGLPAGAVNELLKYLKSI